MFTSKKITMAKTSPPPLFIITFLLSYYASTLVRCDDPPFVRSLDRKLLGLKEEKWSHFRLFWHDVLSGPDPTAINVVQAVNNTKTGFGAIAMIDDPLTMGPNLSSKEVGRAQGFYALSSKEEFSLLMAMNFAFTEGKYNGSTITIMGKNAVFNKVREMPVIGGSGLFRFARGYAEARTHTFDPITGDATVEYNLFVLHY